MADFESKYTGEEVEQFLDQLANGEAGGGDPLWYEDSEGRAFCDRDIQVDGNIFTNGAVVTGSIGVPSSEGYATGDKGQVLMADGNGGIAWDDLSIPTKISQLNDDRGLIDEQFAQENFIGRSEDRSGMEVALLDQFFSPDATLLYAFPDTANGEEDDVILTRGTVKTINGETIYGSGDISISGGSGGVEPYITIEITVEELRTLAEDSEYYTGGREKAAIKQALAEHRSIFVPQSQDESLAGYAVMSGYYEDLLYLQVISEAGELFSIETDCADDTPIYGYQVSRINLWDSDSTLYGTYPVLNSSDSTVSLLANTYTVITAVMSDKVEIILEEYYRTDRTREYVVQFTVSPTAEGVELIVPDNVVWADGVLPAMTPGKTYEISFLSTSGDNSITATFLEF